MFRFRALGLDGWSTAKRLAPVRFPSCLLSGLLVRWAAAKKLGSHWAPFMFPFWAPGWDPNKLPSFGWVGRGEEAGLHWAHFIFAFWGARSDGWWAPVGLLFSSFWAPGSDGWAAANELGSHWDPFMFPFRAPGSDGWAVA